MAFTAGSTELAKANKLGQQLANLYASYGYTVGYDQGSHTLFEKYARKLGFGITGLTSGAGFPPFGSVRATAGAYVSLQNPRGETVCAGIGVGNHTFHGAAATGGATLGIYLLKYVRTGKDYRAQIYSGLTIGAALTAGENGFTFFGRASGITFRTGDRIVFGGNEVLFVNVPGATTVRAWAQFIPVASPSSFSAPAGSAFNSEEVGLTRGGVVGQTFEAYTRDRGGVTASVWFGGTLGSNFLVGAQTINGGVTLWAVS